MHSLVRRYLKTGIAFLALGLGLGLWMMVQRELLQQFPSPYVVSAHTHAILVGFVMMMILGVALWLFPRPAKEDTRYSPRAAEVAYWLVGGGTALRVTGELARSGASAAWLRVATLAAGVLQVVGLLVFFISGVAETNRPPFDLPEADTELVAGYQTEYSGMRYALFAMAEYINVITLSGLAVTLFFGGWSGPFLPGPLWFFVKILLVVFLFMWLRATLPRLRYDQLMQVGWKVLLPVATLNAVVTAVLVVYA